MEAAVPESGGNSRVGGDRRRALPSVDRLLQLSATRPLLAAYPRELVVDALRAGLADARTEATGVADADAIIAHATTRLMVRFAPSLRPVINATGVILHTNLGRAPLSQA